MRRIDFLRENLAVYFGPDQEKSGEAYDNLAGIACDLDGGGFGDCEIDFAASGPDSLVITGTVQKYTEDGYYDGHARFRVAIEPMFFGDFHLTEEYKNADDNLRDEIGGQIWHFLDCGMDGKEEFSPKTAGLELYHDLFAKRMCDKRGNAAWSKKHAESAAKLLASAETGRLKNLHAELFGKREMTFAGDWAGKPFTAKAVPDFEKGARITVQGENAEIIEKALLDALSRDLRENPAKGQKPKGGF